MAKYIILLGWAFWLNLTAMSQNSPAEYKGRVNSENGEPIAGATIFSLTNKVSTISDKDGKFVIKLNRMPDTLVVSYVGYNEKKIILNSLSDQNIEVVITVSVGMLSEVVINTGYQTLTSQKTTGSFVKVDNELFNRRVGSDVLSRLEGVVSGLLVDRRNSSPTQLGIDAGNIQVRGVSTITESIKSPLIILDNFPYEGDINSINPNDIESITVLRDAAAAAIWGAKAGNGVIVITTKSGKFNQPLNISFNTNITIQSKPDLFYYPQMSTSEFVDVEAFLFNKGFYDADLSNTFTYPSITPVVEMLQKRKMGLITPEDSLRYMSEFKSYNLRKDFNKYIYQNGIARQYSLNLSGGTDKIRYNISGSHDRSNSTLKGDKNHRTTLAIQNIITPNTKLEINTSIRYAQTMNQNNSIGGLDNFKMSDQKNMYAYGRLADEYGNSIAITKDYRLPYIDTAGQGLLQEWEYFPLKEQALNDNNNAVTDILLNAGIRYKVQKRTSIEVKYQFGKTLGKANNYKSEETYFTRNLINLFTQIQNGVPKYIVPLGGILDFTSSETISHSGRIQVNNASTLGHHHTLNTMGGLEIRSSNATGYRGRLYGFRSDVLTNASIDYVNFYPLYGNRGSSTIPNFTNVEDRTNRFVSLFLNLNYSFKEKYSLSFSARQDASNLFGVKSNDKWQPLWSSGIAWNITNEEYFKSDLFQNLRLRLTYGFSGNVNNSIATSTLIQYGASTSSSIIRQSSAIISQAAHPHLTWETVNALNAAVDFSMLKNRISGSVELYRKETVDMIAPTPLDPTTGISIINKNSGKMKTEGLDLSLLFVPIKNRFFNWQSSVLVSIANSKVTNLMVDNSKSIGANIAGYGLNIVPTINKSPYAIYSLKWKGLDPLNGDPIGFLNGQESKNYLNIINQTLVSDLVYHGSALPVIFGSWRNEFSYKRITASINLVYKFKYYFRKNTLAYYSLFYANVTHGDYSRRWQKPGDENYTSVPSLEYPINSTHRDQFYASSTANVLKGDHIRLQDIQISYFLNKDDLKSKYITGIRFYVYANNIGIIWRSNKEKLDPDYSSAYQLYPVPKTFSVGMKLDF